MNPTLQAIDSAFDKQYIDRPTKILYQLYAGLKPERLPPEFRPTATRDQAIKCATPILQDYYQHKEEFAVPVTQRISQMMGAENPPRRSLLSASGRFMIFYEVSGDNAVPSGDTNSNNTPDYAEWAAAAADSSWRHEIQTLGYTDPVIEISDPYPIYIEDLKANGFFGFTSAGDNRGLGGSTYIVINSQLDQPAFTQNDHPNPARGAVNVTIAHELKHAVQYANSEWYTINDRSNGPHSIDWSEMDAVYMEEVVYNNVNDYYNYISAPNSIFSNEDHTIPIAYSGVSWFIYFDEYYGPEFWASVWNRIQQRFKIQKNHSNPSYLTMPEAISATLNKNYYDNFNDANTRANLWHIASGPSLSTPDFGFSERQNYPVPTINFNLAGRDSLPAEQTIDALSAQYIEINATLKLPGFVILTLNDTNDFASLGILAYFNNGDTKFTTYHANSDGPLNVNTGWKWDQLSKLGLVVTNGNTIKSTTYQLQVDSNIPEVIIFDPNYPNPFSDRTTIPLSLPEDADLQVKVFDTTGRLVETLVDEQREAGRNPLIFKAAGLASGIYFVQVIIDGELFVQKMTLIK